MTRAFGTVKRVNERGCGLGHHGQGGMTSSDTPSMYLNREFSISAPGGRLLAGPSCGPA